MSKMPAKKKSCFQITSVTTAQAASSITEDTESLDDPDESRTEDVSSEIFDVSRATDYGPEDVPERSSSEETLNNVGDAETSGTTSPNLPQEAPGVRGNGQAAGPQHQPPATAAPQPPVAAACTSRFRVIKLDHGSGEPYRRGRWTCTEYYDRDPESGSLITRSGDAIRHTGTYDHSADSGLGATGGSTVHAAHGADSGADSSLSADSVSGQPAPHFTGAGQQQQPMGGGAAVPTGAAGQPVYAPSQLLQQGQSYMPTHSVLQGGHNGPSAMPISQHQSNVSGGQSQQFTYSQAQMQPGHLMVSQSSGQVEYVQHIPLIQSQGATQQPANPVTAGSGPTGGLPGQHLQAGGAQLMGLHSVASDSVSQGSGLLQNAPTAQGHPAHLQQPGGVAQSTVSSVGMGQQKPISQQQVSGSSQVSGIPGGHNAMTPGVQTVPIAVPSTGVSGLASSASTTPISMPISPATFVQSPLSSHTSVSRSNSLIPTVGLPSVQGTTNAHTGLPQANINQFQTQPLAGQIDDRRKSEPLPQPPISLISEKSFVKVPIADTLTNPLHLPVFGLPIPVDGEDDSTSGANVVAIDNKIEQAMDLVKSHLMYAVREEVEVLKEQIKELIEKNSTLERENALLKSLSNSDQLSQLSGQGGTGTCQQPPVTTAPLTATQTAHPPQQPNGSYA
ncbi:TSC22 domain family protein 2 isoform X2 [Pseudophryne corroboree]|uniref:TSC22 domain family protein 2 isoform X2 n=1 Tax=Pseudophryne corroboree TaxID=495146 RepID=UPI00308196CE